jgi:hypothetical protein
MNAASPGAPLHGVIAEFESPAALIEAARQARAAGYRKMDAYTPYPIEELAHALALPRTKLPVLVLAGGALGCATGLAMQWFATAVHYPLNVGGRPLASWPSYVPITFELTVLFNVPSFALASRDRFFLCIESADPLFDPPKTKAFLESVGAREVTEVED